MIIFLSFLFSKKAPKETVVNWKTFLSMKQKFVSRSFCDFRKSKITHYLLKISIRFEDQNFVFIKSKWLIEKLIKLLGLKKRKKQLFQKNFQKLVYLLLLQKLPNKQKRTPNLIHFLDPTFYRLFWKQKALSSVFCVRFTNFLTISLPFFLVKKAPR